MATSITKIPASEITTAKHQSRVIYYGKQASLENLEVDSKVLEDKKEDEFELPTQGPVKINMSTIKTLVVDVIVRNAVSPLNFTIQNYRQSQNLQRLESEMTSYYTESTRNLLTFTDLILHGNYAVKYKANSTTSQPITSEDERWVRCQIMKPFHEHMPVLTYLIDHGIYHVAEPNWLQPLKKSFLTLPIQSYEAKLHFFDKIPHQFTTQDCLRFQKLVEGKPFCAILISKFKNLKNHDDKISIVLVDTTTSSRDDYVHQHFVTNKLENSSKGR